MKQVYIIQINYELASRIGGSPDLLRYMGTDSFKSRQNRAWKNQHSVDQATNDLVDDFYDRYMK